MTYGIFSDEGCAETGFATEDAAEAGIADLLAGDWEGVELAVHETCPDHPEEKLAECEECVCSRCAEHVGPNEIARNPDRTGGVCDDCAEGDEED